MSTPPDGIPPTMQMYLFHVPGRRPTRRTPSCPTSSAVRRQRGVPRVHPRPVQPAGHRPRRQLDAEQHPGRRDGRGLERLLRHGLPGDQGLRAGHRQAPARCSRASTSLAGRAPLRTMAIDCPVGARPQALRRPFDGRRGGYTYGDFPDVAASPRCTPAVRSGPRPCGTSARSSATGSPTQLITRACRSRQTTPTTSTCATRSCRPTWWPTRATTSGAIWQVFANRGMGYFAGSLDSGDTPAGGGLQAAAAAVHPARRHHRDRDATTTATRSRARWCRSPARATSSRTSPTPTASTASEVCSRAPTARSRPRHRASSPTPGR